MTEYVTYILNAGAELVGKKWRAVIIWHLKDGPLRFSEIKRKIPGISVKVLSEVLREMESNHLIVRKQYDGIPVRVTYEIHPDASGFIEANILCTLRIGEFLIKNADKMNVPKDMVNQLTNWLDEQDIYKNYNN